MKVIIAGSREFQDYEYMKDCINNFKFDIDEIISGCANGADILGERYARENNIFVTKFKPDWIRYGKRAGYIRNMEMAEYVSPDGGLIAFPIGESRGTRMMIDIATDFNLYMEIYER